MHFSAVIALASATISAAMPFAFNGTGNPAWAPGGNGTVHHRDLPGPPFVNGTKGVVVVAPPFANATWPNDLHARGNNVSGSALVYNACDFSVQSNIVHPLRPGTSGFPEEICSAVGPGETLSHPFSHDPDMGISWKLWRVDAGTSNHQPVQLEWTHSPSAGRTWYDLSMVNAGAIEWLDPATHEGEVIAEGANNDGSGTLTGMVAVEHPFGGNGEGMNLAPQGGDGENCGSIICPAGQQYCTKAYNTDTDNQAMRDCSQSVDLKLTLCG